MPSPSASDPIVPSASLDDPLTDLLHRWARERAHQRAFTFVDYPALNSPGRHRTLTWGQLDAAAGRAAGQIAAAVRPGDRVALLMPQGLEYVAGFLGCLLARTVAVPLFTPDLPGHQGRVAAVLEDCEPACALVTAAGERPVANFVRDSGITLPLVAIGGVEAAGPVHGAARPERPPDGDGEQGARPPVDMHEVAYLQYTSGSTRIPAGVMISHRNMMANARQAIEAFDAAAQPSTTVGWLPLFHDMGLVLSLAAPVAGGFPSVLMDPIAFLEKPDRWLTLLSQYPGVLSAAPNFAYDFCASRITQEQAIELRLDRVRALINGSEPVRASTVRRFQRTFTVAGLRPETQCPSYGLAEATVFVATDGPGAAPREVMCRRDALAEGRIVPVGETCEPGRSPAQGADVASLVSCGVPVGQELRIVDPGTRQVLPEGVVGEILLRGPNVALGYWKHAEQTAEVFDVELPDTGRPTWMRTGDLGALHEGRLLVTGRLKDLIIADGRNHYPQDIEETVQEALAYVRRGRVAVFTVPDAADESVERIVAVAEHNPEMAPTDDERADADRAARGAVAAVHGVRLERLALVPSGTVARTSSGKVARNACRDAYLAGAYERGAQPESSER
jgi:acyl-CoA synthetase (AMP-forming)/AMP-acid ligase II